MRYTVVLEQEEDGGYVASVPALPGCVSQGDNRAGALSNIREAIELYIEDCRDAGDPVPTEAGKEFVEIEANQVMAAFLGFLSKGISAAPRRIEPLAATRIKKARELTRRVKVRDDDTLPDDVTL